MNLKSLCLAVALISTPAIADDCLPGFGPGCVTPGPAPAPERIPIPGYLPTIWIGGDQYVQPACSVVANEFALCIATLPGDYLVGGLSPSCPPANETCPNLPWLALSALRLNIDAALRAKSSIQ